jgi:hypothetical protein
MNSWFLHLLTIITTLQKYGIKISWQICFNNSFYIVYITVVEFTGTRKYTELNHKIIHWGGSS